MVSIKTSPKTAHLVEESNSQRIVWEISDKLEN